MIGLGLVIRKQIFPETCIRIRLFSHEFLPKTEMIFPPKAPSIAGNFRPRRMPEVVKGYSGPVYSYLDLT